MKLPFFLLALLLACGISPAQIIQPSLTPNSSQQKMISRSYGMFIHFGINTFSGKEWTDGTLAPSLYNPTELDTDQWAKCAKDAGMSYVILITKHHEGFCLWDSPHTEYDVASSPVKTNVVKAMAASCKKHGIKLGLYYSLWDRNWGDGVMRGNRADLSPQQSSDYIDYMKKQLTELLTDNGDICELWFDGGWVLPREDWQIESVYAHVKSLQPNCLVGVNWGIGEFGNPDFHAVHPNAYRIGQPIRYYPSDFRLGDPTLPEFPDVKHFSGPQGRLHYLPFETTVCLNKHWFWHPYDQGLRSIDELLPLYDHSTAQDNVLILNSPPNRKGLMDERNITRLKEFAAALGAQPGQTVPRNLAEFATAYADSVWTKSPGDWSAQSALDGNQKTRWASSKVDPTFIMQWEQAQTLDFVRIREFEERIEGFELQAHVDGKWTTLHQGKGIGPRLLIRFPRTTTTALRLKILKSAKEPSLHHIGAGLSK